MKIVDFSQNNTLLNQFLAEIRDVHIQETACASAGTLSVSERLWLMKSAVIFLICR